MAKRVSSRPDWLDAPMVQEVCSVSTCIFEAFCDYIPYWKHNGYWFFDSPQVITLLARENGISLVDTTLVFYRGYDEQFDADLGVWTTYDVTPDIATNVSSPEAEKCLGYDVVTYSQHHSPECSPLSCCHLAAEIDVNKYCLLDSLDFAINLLGDGVFDDTEPSPFRIIGISKVPWPNVI